MFIYYFKSILSITDIQALLKPINDTYFPASEDLSLEDIYNEVFRLQKSQVDVLKEDIANRYRLSRETFQDAPEKDQEFLKTFSFICLLSFDVYVKKQLIESLIDDLNPDTKEKKKK